MDTLTNTGAISFFENIGYGRGFMDCESRRPSQAFIDLQILADLDEAIETERDRNGASERATPQDERKVQSPSSHQGRSPGDPEAHALLAGLPELSPPPSATGATGRAADGQTAASESSTARSNERGAANGREQADSVRGGRASESKPQADSGPPATVGAPLKGKTSPAFGSDQSSGGIPRGGEEPAGRLVHPSDASPKGFQQANLQGPVSEVYAAGLTKSGTAGMNRSTGAEVQLEGPKGMPRTQFDLSALTSAGSVVSTARMPGQTPVAVNVGSGGTPAGTLNVGEQILDSVRASLAQGDRQVLVRLHPPELGTVLVRFREDDRHLIAMLEVAREDTRREIEQALPQVLRGLRDAGIHVRRFEVVTSDQIERDLARGQTQQNGASHDQNPGHDRDDFARASQARGSWAGADHVHRLTEDRVGPLPIDAHAGRIDLFL